MQRMTEAIFRNHIFDKNIAVIGLGVSNKPLIMWLGRMGAKLTVADSRPLDHKVWSEANLTWHEANIEVACEAGQSHLDFLHQQRFDYIFRSPSLRPDDKALVAARELGAIVTTEIGLLLALCGSHVTAVTGSDGKTTTTTLIAKLYEAAGKKVWLGGNIGMPLLEHVFDMQPDDEVVLELSSFQLFDLSVGPDVAVYTNVTPNHLDIHRDFAEYQEAKLNILTHQTCLGTTVLNANDSILAQTAVKAKGKVVWFNQSVVGYDSWFCVDGQLAYASPDGEVTYLLERKAIRTIGEHNIYNYLAALAAVGYDVAAKSVKAVAATFQGVEHRIEPVATIDNVSYINSSIDSSPTRTIATLTALKTTPPSLILICGGKDKNCDYTDLGEVIAQTCKKVILCGANATMISVAVQKSQSNFAMVSVTDYPEALQLAQSYAVSGDSVVLSPAGTSFDRFANFVERGKWFKACVADLEHNDA